MKNSLASLALLTATLGAACGTAVSYMPTNRPVRPLGARPPESVEIFASGRPQRPFTEIGIIETQQESRLSLHSERETFGVLREEAARVGCDGLIILGANDAVVGGSLDGDGSVGTLRGYRGVCIQWLPDGDSAPLPPRQPEPYPGPPSSQEG